MPDRSRAVLYTVVVFLAGALAGGLATNLFEHFWLHPTQAVAGRAPENLDKRARSHYIEQLRRELSLSDEQALQLDSILDETMRQYHDLHTFSHHVRQEGIARFRALLTDEQRKKFDKIVLDLNEPDAKKKEKK